MDFFQDFKLILLSLFVCFNTKLYGEISKQVAVSLVLQSLVTDLSLSEDTSCWRTWRLIGGMSRKSTHGCRDLLRHTEHLSLGFWQENPVVHHSLPSLWHSFGIDCEHFPEPAAIPSCVQSLWRRWQRHAAQIHQQSHGPYALWQFLHSCVPRWRCAGLVVFWWSPSTHTHRALQDARFAWLGSSVRWPHGH